MQIASTPHLIVAVALAFLAAGSGYLAVQSVTGHPRWDGSILGLWGIWQFYAATIGFAYFAAKAFGA